MNKVPFSQTFAGALLVAVIGGLIVSYFSSSKKSDPQPAPDSTPIVNRDRKISLSVKNKENQTIEFNQDNSMLLEGMDVGDRKFKLRVYVRELTRETTALKVRVGICNEGGEIVGWDPASPEEIYFSYIDSGKRSTITWNGISLSPRVEKSQCIERTIDKELEASQYEIDYLRKPLGVFFTKYKGQLWEKDLSSLIARIKTG